MFIDVKQLYKYTWNTARDMLSVPYIYKCSKCIIQSNTGEALEYDLHIYYFIVLLLLLTRETCVLQNFCLTKEKADH